MKTRKYFLLAAAFVLLASLCVGAMAQGKMGKKGPALQVRPIPVLPSVTVNAIEVADGTVGYDSLTTKETVFGYSFLGRTTGSFPGSININMNCTPTIPMVADTTELTGGAWTLPVYIAKTIDGSGYAGSLYGTINTGKMNWDKTGTYADVSFVLNVDGGTQTFVGLLGYATFVGTMSIDEKTQETTLTGELVFTLK